MAVPALIAVIVAGLGGVFLFKNWDKICAWFGAFITKLKTVIKEKMHGIANAAIIVGERISEAVAEFKHKLFYKEDGKWMEETTKRQVDESEVPPYIRAKIAQQEKEQEKEVDVTKEMELELGQSV